mmetsp:Transcript_16811/g.25266  ORF Transcript_16811/g.25266 Transcript_16811/m.25266 type:complete len:342 (+) Transcript_16811:81-1106(+)
MISLLRTQRRLMSSSALSAVSRPSMLQRRRPDDSKPEISKILPPGSPVSVKLKSLTPVGARVAVAGQSVAGFISRSELDYYEASTRVPPLRVGDIISAYVGQVKSNNSVDVLLRPVGADRIKVTGETILKLLELMPDGVAPIGDKSLPYEISRYLVGVSRSDFRRAVGMLYKHGFVEPSAYEIRLIKRNESSLQKQKGMVTVYIKNICRSASTESVKEFLSATLNNFNLSKAGGKKRNDKKSTSISTSNDDKQGSGQLVMIDARIMPGDGSTRVRNSGYGFIDVSLRNIDSSNAESIDALSLVRKALDGKVFKGKRIAVNEATQKKLDDILKPKSQLIESS